MGRYLDRREPVKQTCPIIDEAKECISTLDGIITSYDNHFEESDINDIDFNLDRVKIILEELRSANSSLRDWGNAWCEKASEFEGEIYDLKDEYESKIGLLNSDISDYKKDIDRYVDKIDSLNDDIYDLNEQIDSMEY